MKFLNLCLFLAAATLLAPAAHARVFYEAGMKLEFYYSNIHNEDATFLGEVKGLLLSSDDKKFTIFTLDGADFPVVLNEFALDGYQRPRISFDVTRDTMKSLLSTLAAKAKHSSDRAQALKLVARYFDPTAGSVKQEKWTMAACNGYCSYFTEARRWQFHDDLSPESLHLIFSLNEHGRVRGEPGRRGD